MPSTSAAATDGKPQRAARFDFDRYYPLVRRVATRVARRLPPHVAIDDLVSAGVLGLLDSARRYDAARCERLETFVEFRSRARCSTSCG